MRVELIYDNSELPDYGLDEIEEFLEELFDEVGFGDVSGAGSSPELSNIDIEIDEEQIQDLLGLIKNNKTELHITNNTQIRSVDGQKETFYKIT